MDFKREQLLLYAVTDNSWLHGQTLYEQVQEALAGGVTMVQLREKQLTGEALLKEALEVKALCARYRVPFILNDDVELARRIDADGVHIGQNDMELQKARRILGPDKIIGVSARTVAQAQEAQAHGADYLGVGAVFTTGTKSDAVTVGYGRILEVCGCVSIPAVAIGGITADNMMQLAGSGISGIAVVSAIFAQPDIRTAAEKLRAGMEKMLISAQNKSM